MKLLQVCVICSQVFGCVIGDKKRECDVDCQHHCNDNELCNIEHSICDDCRNDDDWQI